MRCRGGSAPHVRHRRLPPCPLLPLSWRLRHPSFFRWYAWQVGLSWLLAAVQTLTAVVWACLDPLRHLSTEVACTKPDDAACNEALAAGALCSLPREAWAWRAP